MKFRILVGKQKNGTYTGECASLHGCTAEGKTFKEFMKNMDEIIEIQLRKKKGRNTEPSYSKEIIMAQEKD